MAEATTCVMHPFSNSTSLPTFSIENHEESAIMYKGIGDSISFGRYVCEDLEWEKWSSFNNTSNNRNRYVAEAEKYSKPGSVAQKKAYFEAHFKRMAALKAAAALLQQANAAAAAAAAADHVQQIDTSIISSSHQNIHVTLSSKLQSQTNNHKQPEMVARFVVPQKQPILEDEHDLTPAPPPPPPNHKSEHNDLTPPPPPPPPNHKSSQKHEIVVKDEKQEEASEIEILTHQKMTEPPLQDENEEASVKVTAVRIKRNPPLSSYMSSAIIVDSRGKENSKDKILIAESAAATSVNNSVHPGKENYATPIKNSKSISINCDVQKKKTPLRMSINREFNRILSPVIKKLGTSSSKPSTPSKTPASANKASMYNVPQNPPMTPDLTNRGATSPSRDGSKISSPIIPNSFCLTGETSTRRKQKLEEKFNAATASEKASQPSKFKEKTEAELNKFRQSFCFKVTSSPDYYGDNGIFKSPKHKNESTQHKSPNGGRQPNNNKSALPPRKPSLKPHIGLRSKRTTTLPTS